MSLLIKDRAKSLLVTGKYSLLFFQQFVNGVKKGVLDFEQIAKEIEYLEGTRSITTTKKESMFKGELLEGLWHKHFFDAQHIPTNCLKMLEKQQEKICRKNLSEDEFLEAILNLIDKSVVNYDKTGDWIIYQKTKQGNRYLTLARHNEPDEKIYERIKPYLTNQANCV